LINISDIIKKYNKNKDYLTSVIENSKKPLLIITHHLPSFEMILSEYDTSPCKSHFASDLNHLFKKPVIGWICGHSDGFNEKINNIPCIMNSIGYPSEPRRNSSLNYTISFNI
jgi:hypothetical protein